MSAQLLDGKALATQIKDKVRAQVDTFVAQQQRRPGLAVILVGADAASKLYVRNKRNSCDQVGFHSELYELDANTSQKELLELIVKLNAKEIIDGILVQLPLPDHINAEAVIENIAIEKDVDGFHPYNFGRMGLAMPLLRPCTSRGVMSLLEQTCADLVGKDAVIIGKSNIVGRPMALELLAARCTITVCHSKTKNLPDKVRAADIVIAAVGVANFVKSDWVGTGAIVIDVGINRLEDGKLCGDIDFEAVKDKASWITPVPGGVGPMTVATLMQNTLQAYLNRTQSKRT